VVFGHAFLGHTIQTVGDSVGHALPAISGAAEWVVTAVGSGLVGLAIGAVLIPFAVYVVGPFSKAIAGLRGQRDVP